VATTGAGLPEHLKQVLAIEPEAEAIEFEGRWHGWGAVAALANGVSGALERAGLAEGAPVGLLLRNDPAMVAALVGVIASRRCAVTLDPHQGADRIAEELRALRLPAVVGVPDDWQREEIGGPVRDVGGLGLRVDMQGGVHTVATPGAAATAYDPLPGVAVQMLTSGTTGRPKRVALSLAAIEQSLIGARHYEKNADATPRLRSGVSIIVAPLVHVGGLFRVLQCVADGRRFALLERFRVEPWLDLVRRHRPRTASLVPAALRMVLEADLDVDALRCLSTVLCGTAPLPPEEAEAFEAKYGVPVLTTYGATEFAGGVAGWNLADHREFRADKRGSVGRAHPGCALRVVDAETGDVLGPGEEGLLEVRSAQLGPESGWVRTTDLVVLDADGFLFIRGRADRAIIRGGFKILPDVVRAALESHPSVREACVVGLDDARLGQVPAAAVTLRDDEPVVDEATLREHARRRLSGYQVPARIRVVDALPRTPSLKVSQPDVIALLTEPG
jgi:acyl-CoA synthetase (AMP-forming)/AMP-acid ligase II